MNYSEALNYIHSLNRFGIKPGLLRINALLAALGNPHKNLKVIHIAGTNGKGSTSTAISNIMIAAGKKTGLFISPFVVDFRERIQINGEYISEDDLSRLTERLKSIVPSVEKSVEDNVTEFEFITALMFCYFKEQNCDTVVLEVGLGGRLDSTNVIENPLASVIAKIALDHQAVLGDTIEEIAAEKCGIIKNGCPVITTTLQDRAALTVIENTAKEKSAPLMLAKAQPKNAELKPYGSTFIYKGMEIEVNMPGAHQIENMTAAAETALTLGLDKEYIIKGIAATKFPARLEVLSKEPLVILDGAHNENGATALSDYLKLNNLSPVVIMGMMKDKNCEGALSLILPHCKAAVTVTVKGNDRTALAEELKIMAQKHIKDVTAAENYETALSLAKEKAKALVAPLLICGSLYLASDIREQAIKEFKN